VWYKLGKYQEEQNAFKNKDKREGEGIHVRFDTLLETLVVDDERVLKKNWNARRSLLREVAGLKSRNLGSGRRDSRVQRRVYTLPGGEGGGGQGASGKVAGERAIRYPGQFRTQ